MNEERRMYSFDLVRQYPSEIFPFWVPGLSEKCCPYRAILLKPGQLFMNVS